MEFRDYAATETSALLGRLLSSQADGAVQQLRAMREALDAAARAAEAAAAAAPHAAEMEVGALASKLGAAAAAETQRIDQEARAALDAARHELKTLQAESTRQAATLAEVKAQEETLRAEVQRQTERAEAADRDLDATIEAHKQVDAARIDAEASHRREAQARAALESEMSELRGMLDSARSEAERLSDQLESEGAQNAVMTAERESAAAECVALTAQLEAATAQFGKVSEKFEAATAQLKAVASQLDLTRARVQELEREGESRHETFTQLEERLNASLAAEAGAREQAAAAHAQAERMTGDLDRANGELHRLTGELDRANGELTRRIGELEGANTERSRAGGELEQAHAELQRTNGELGHINSELDRARSEVVALVGQTARLTSLVEASVRSVGELGHATNIADLLASLVKQLAAEFPRVALFRVKENHVEGEHQLGFDMKADVAKLMIPLNVDSLITRAASSGAAEQLSEKDLAGGSHAPFGGSPATAFALPIGFQDETIAVAYIEADLTPAEQGLAIHEASTGFARLLVQHTAVLLTRLSQELKMLSELREYASMLLQEADQMYAADMEAGKSDADRRRRLQETLDCARQLYSQRAALEGPAAAGLLDEQIAIQAANSTPFACELASLAGHDQQQSRRTAS